MQNKVPKSQDTIPLVVIAPIVHVPNGLQTSYPKVKSGCPKPPHPTVHQYCLQFKWGKNRENRLAGKKKKGGEGETTHADQSLGESLLPGHDVSLYMLHEAKSLGTITNKHTQSSNSEHSQGRQQRRERLT